MIRIKTRTLVLGAFCTVGLMLAGVASATPVSGPVYPPAGGVTWAASGAASAGDSPGTDWNYSAFDDSQFLELYWGVLSPSGGLDGTANAMSFAGISGTTATWSVLANYTSPGGPSDPASGVYTMRLEVDITGLGANPWVLEASVDGLTAAAPGIGAVIDNSSGLDYSANLFFSVNAGPGGTWIAANDVPQLPGGLTQTNLTGGFFQVVPEPSTAVLMGLGLVGIGARSRRSR